jgi:hypothetical protein
MHEPDARTDGHRIRYDPQSTASEPIPVAVRYLLGQPRRSANNHVKAVTAFVRDITDEYLGVEPEVLRIAGTEPVEEWSCGLPSPKTSTFLTSARTCFTIPTY